MVWQPIIGFALLLATWLRAVSAQKCADPPEDHIGASVFTTGGLVEGHAALRRPAVSEYLGIPYASAPVGDLRFAPPVAYGFNGTIHATSFVRYFSIQLWKVRFSVYLTNRASTGQSPCV
jgi:hypothetical protein